VSRSLRNRRFREKGAKTCCFWDGSRQAGGRRRALGLQHFYNQTRHKFAIYEGRWYIKIEVVALAEDVVLSVYDALRRTKPRRDGVGCRKSCGRHRDDFDALVSAKTG
jgi:hypothetical protein